MSMSRRMSRRSIPACAGETAYPLTAAVLVGVYPRVCGGNLVVCGRHRDYQGLSPRVRGKRNRKLVKSTG